MRLQAMILLTWTHRAHENAAASNGNCEHLLKDYYLNASIYVVVASSMD
jgi:hypothetical protein